MAPCHVHSTLARHIYLVHPEAQWVERLLLAAWVSESAPTETYFSLDLRELQIKLKKKFLHFARFIRSSPFKRGSVEFSERTRLSPSLSLTASWTCLLNNVLWCFLNRYQTHGLLTNREPLGSQGERGIWEWGTRTQLQPCSREGKGGEQSLLSYASDFIGLY